MAVQPQRATWTDERLDDLNQAMRDGFARNEADHRVMREEIRDRFAKNGLEHEATRREMREGFDRNDQRFDRNDQRFDQLASRIDSLQLTLIVGMIGLIGAIIAGSIFG